MVIPWHGNSNSMVVLPKLTTVGRLLIFSHTLCINIIKQIHIGILWNSSCITGKAAKIAHTCVPIIYNHPLGVQHYHPVANPGNRGSRLWSENDKNNVGLLLNWKPKTIVEVQFQFQVSLQTQYKIQTNTSCWLCNLALKIRIFCTFVKVIMRRNKKSPSLRAYKWTFLHQTVFKSKFGLCLFMVACHYKCNRCSFVQKNEKVKKNYQ